VYFQTILDVARASVFTRSRQMAYLALTTVLFILGAISFGLETQKLDVSVYSWDAPRDTIEVWVQDKHWFGHYIIHDYAVLLSGWITIGLLVSRVFSFS
jgi:hypothetical protein